MGIKNADNDKNLRRIKELYGVKIYLQHCKLVNNGEHLVSDLIESLKIMGLSKKDSEGNLIQDEQVVRALLFKGYTKESLQNKAPFELFNQAYTIMKENPEQSFTGVKEGKARTVKGKESKGKTKQTARNNAFLKQMRAVYNDPMYKRLSDIVNNGEQPVAELLNHLGIIGMYREMPNGDRLDSVDVARVLLENGYSTHNLPQSPTREKITTIFDVAISYLNKR